MNNRSQNIRLGIFLLTGGALIFSLLVFFTARELFKSSDTYYVAYHDLSVSGMEVGSPVKYLGIKVGTVSDIRIDPEDVTRIIVELSLKPGTPVKKDSQADIISMGITGLKAIEIRGGSNEAPLLEEEEFIQSGSSLSAEISGRAEIIAEKMEIVLNNLQNFTSPNNTKKVFDAIDQMNTMFTNADQTISKLDTVIYENRKQFQNTMASAEEMGYSLVNAGKTLDSVMLRINSFTRSDTIDQIMFNIKEISETINQSDLELLIKELTNLSSETANMVEHLDRDLNKGSEQLIENLEILRRTLENINEASRKINNNPSVLIKGRKMKNIPDNHLKN
jgi:phospholipid/cholesterol/gamma-HCH transport system substrate-binding protein